MCDITMSSSGVVPGMTRKSAAIGPNVSFNQEVSISGGGVTTVDVLFVIDNSGSMKQEQERLAAQVGRLVRDLASPPDNDGDGNPDWNPVEELRIGIATTDVGTANAANSAGNLYCPGAGDDGEIQGGVFIYRELKFEHIKPILKDTIYGTGTVVLIIVLLLIPKDAIGCDPISRLLGAEIVQIGIG